MTEESSAEVPTFLHLPLVCEAANHKQSDKTQTAVFCPKENLWGSVSANVREK